MYRRKPVKILTDYLIKHTNTMKNNIPFILLACTFIAVLILETNVALSQNKIDAPEQAQQAETYVKGFTSGRVKSVVGGVIALLSVIIGLRVKRRGTSEPRPRSLAITGLVLGIAALALSILHLASTSGGFGTGGGKAGAIVALVLGMSGAILSALSLRGKEAQRG